MARPLFVFLAIFLAMFVVIDVVNATPTNTLEVRSGCWSCCKRCFCQCVAHPPRDQVGNYNTCALHCGNKCTAWQMVKLAFHRC